MKAFTVNAKIICFIWSRERERHIDVWMERERTISQDNKMLQCLTTMWKIWQHISCSGVHADSSWKWEAFVCCFMSENPGGRQRETQHPEDALWAERKQARQTSNNREKMLKIWGKWADAAGVEGETRRGQILMQSGRKQMQGREKKLEKSLINATRANNYAPMASFKAEWLSARKSG